MMEHRLQNQWFEGEAVTSKIGVTLDRLRKIVVVRANHLRVKVKSFKGSAKKQRFLQQEWKLSEDAIGPLDLR